MLNLNSNLLSGNAPWDTNYARTYLQISADQLEKLNKIPGWSKTKATSENDNALENTEKQLSHSALPSKESNLVIGTEASPINISSFKNYNSALQSKPNPATEKEEFLKKVCLSPVKENCSPVYSLKRSSSLPDLYGKLISPEELSLSKLEEIYRKQTHSKKDFSGFKNSLLSNVLNERNAVCHESLSGDKTSEINHKSSGLLENPNQQDIQKFKTLDDSVLRFSNQTALKQDMRLFEKKLLLLEKRLSPSKEMITLPFNSKIINVENFNLKPSQSLTPANEILTSVGSSDSIKNFPDIIENSSLSVAGKSLESQANKAKNFQDGIKKSPLSEKEKSPAKNLSEKIENTLQLESCKSYESLSTLQSLGEKSHLQKNTCESLKDRTGDASKTAACNFDSFVSPPLPCGQRIPKELPLSESQLEKPAELNSQCRSQNEKRPDKTSVPENSSCTASVFPDKSNELVSDIASGKELGTKRKRRSKSEKSSKKFKRNIQFSSAQIRSMMEIMKIFHTEF